jgi:hypothetical protein
VVLFIACPDTRGYVRRSGRPPTPGEE